MLFCHYSTLFRTPYDLVGHIRDLPANAAEIPAKFKKEKWARLGVNVEDDFKPLYVVQPAKKKKISELKSMLADVDRVLLATDEDREGESISWHLLQLLNPKVPVKRMVFHEITEDAIKRALSDTRELNRVPRGACEIRELDPRPSIVSFFLFFCRWCACVSQSTPLSC